MGECLISRRGGELYELPVLNTSYPKDITMVQSTNGEASFEVRIDTDGRPATYTYQWYVNEEKVSGATSRTYKKTGLSSAATYKVYCEVVNKAGRVTSRVATLKVNSYKPAYTFSGAAPTLTENSTGNWTMTIKETGKLKFTNLGCFTGGIDVFVVGGGGSGGVTSNGALGGGGGGGYVKTGSYASLKANTEYTITVGAGGTAGSNGADGGQTTAFGVSANGGKTPGSGNRDGGNGGSGGGGSGYRVGKGGNGGSDGSDGTAGGNYSDSTGLYYGGTGGTGSHATTRAFGEDTGSLYAGGGAGCGAGEGANGTKGAGGGGTVSGNGSTNTGGGGGGNGGNGGSGIVIIRNKRS